MSGPIDGADERLQEILAVVEAKRADTRPRRSSRGYTAPEIWAEVTLIVSDITTLSAQSQLGAARFEAGNRARERDRVRPARGPVEVAVLIAGWLLNRAWAEHKPDKGATVAAAVRGVERAPSEPLTGELAELINGYVDGSIDDAEFVVRLNKTRPVRPSSRRTKGVLAVSGAEDALREAIGRTGAGPGAVWSAFKVFAAQPMQADLPLRVGEDLLLFEWCRWEDRRDRLSIDLVRQFTLVDTDGDYDHLEQLHCEFKLQPGAGERLERNGAIWSSGNLERWIAEVEASPGFATLMRSPSVSGPDIGQERV